MSLNIGMMWNGDIVQGIDYYQKKYNRIVDCVEMNDKMFGLLDLKGRPDDLNNRSIKFVKSKSILDKCYFIGRKEDVDGTPYLFKKED